MNKPITKFLTNSPAKTPAIPGNTTSRKINGQNASSGSFARKRREGLQRNDNSLLTNSNP